MNFVVKLRLKVVLIRKKPYLRVFGDFYLEYTLTMALPWQQGANEIIKLYGNRLPDNFSINSQNWRHLALTVSELSDFFLREGRKRPPPG